MTHNLDFITIQSNNELRMPVNTQDKICEMADEIIKNKYSIQILTDLPLTKTLEERLYYRKLLTSMLENESS